MAKCHSTPEADLNISEDRFGRTEKSSKSHINTTNSHFEILKTHFFGFVTEITAAAPV